MGKVGKSALELGEKNSIMFGSACSNDYHFCFTCVAKSHWHVKWCSDQCGIQNDGCLIDNQDCCGLLLSCNFKFHFKFALVCCALLWQRGMALSMEWIWRFIKSTMNFQCASWLIHWANHIMVLYSNWPYHSNNYTKKEYWNNLI